MWLDYRLRFRARSSHVGIVSLLQLRQERVRHAITAARRTQIISCLVEGNSIRSTERMTETHRDTIMRLLVEVGTGCAAIMDETMRELPYKRVQVAIVRRFDGLRPAMLSGR
jgi:hypothetical protein